MNKNKKVPNPEIVGSSDNESIKKAIKAVCPSDSPILLPDVYYHLATKKSFERFLESDDTNKYKYTGDKKKNPKSFDCVYENELIITKNGFVPIKDIDVGDKVLSYDFGKGYSYKKISNIIDKGLLNGYRVKFKNHTSCVLTENHPMWNRLDRDIPATYKKTKLSNIDLDNWIDRKVPCIRKMEYKSKDIEWLDEDLCFVIGHYLAEGWSQKSGSSIEVFTSGFGVHLTEKILESKDIPYSRISNGNGVPEIYFKKGSKLRQYMVNLKEDSFNIHIPEEIKSLPKNKLLALISGEFYGDGGVQDNNYIISTSSEQFAKDLREISLKIGCPFYIYKQENHMGVGNKPIYRLYYNPNSVSCKDYGHSNLSETQLKSYEYIGQKHFYDVSVNDTSTFFLKNGICLHNCDNYSAVLYGNTSIPKWGTVPIGAVWLSKPAHAVNIFIDENMKVYYVEPQTDDLMLMEEKQDWMPYMIWF